MGPPLEVVLYGRAGCSLCVEAGQMLERIGRRIAIRVIQRDIESDDDLLRRFMFEIPVIEVGGVVVARAPVREGVLEDSLAELARGA